MSDHEISIKVSAKAIGLESYQDHKKAIASLTEASTKGAAEAEGGLLKWAGSIKNVAAAAVAAGVAVVGSIAAMVASVVAFGKRGSTVNDIREQFDILNRTLGNDSATALKVLDAAMDGTVSHFDLMKSTNAALSQGLKLTHDDYRLLGEGARVLADRTGGEAKDAYAALTNAMASGKDVALKSIGLNIDAARATKDYAAALGTEVTYLSEAEQKTAKQIAIKQELTRVLGESGRATMDFGDTVDKAHAAMSNFLDDLSSGIADSKVLGAGIKETGDALAAAFGPGQQERIKTVVKWVEDAAIAMMRLSKSGVDAGAFLAKEFHAIYNVFGNLAQVIDMSAMAFKSFARSVAVGDDVKRIDAELDMLFERMYQRGAALTANSKAQREWDGTAKAAKTTIDSIIAAMVKEAAARDTHKAAVDRSTRAVTSANDASRGHIRTSAEIAAQLKDEADAWDYVQKKQAETMKDLQASMARDGGMGAALLKQLHQAKILREQMAGTLRLDSHAPEGLKNVIVGSFGWQDSEAGKIQADWKRNLDSLAGSLTQLAQVAGGTFGGIVKDIANVVVSFKVVTRSVDDFKEAQAKGDKAGQAVALAGMAEGFMAATGSGGKASRIGGGAAAGAKMGAIAGPWGMAIGAGVGALVGWARSTGPSKEELAARDAQSQMIAQLREMATEGQRTEGALKDSYHTIAIVARDAFIKTGLSAADAEKKVAGLLDTHHPEAFKKAMEDLNGVLNEQQAEAAALNAAIQKYGFTIEELGPTLQRQRLVEQAVALEDEFRLLTASGIDMNLVISKMGPNLNEYVNMAKRAGQEIPAEMQPILQKMVDLGQLTDENGNKINSLDDAGLTFSESMTRGFDRVVGKLNELLEGLGLIPKVLDTIPKNTDINVTTHYRDSGGNRPTFDDDYIPGHAAGGIFSTPHLARIAEGGQAEFIGNSDRTAAFVKEVINQMGAVPGGGGDIVLHITNTLDGRVIDERVERIGQQKLSNGVWRIPQRSVARRAA